MQCASEELKKDKEIVLTAVGKSAYALRYASIKLRRDKEVVLTAASKNISALEYVSNRELGNEIKELIAKAQKSDKKSKEELISEIILEQEKSDEIDKALAEKNSQMKEQFTKE